MLPVLVFLIIKVFEPIHTAVGSVIVEPDHVDSTT